ncbi:hypothetical protein BDK51DRAFT_41400 [Blyttiomyces helicus]|uniref:Uncharacterized protein n=1 Tax=Blyttiomyces helicus TaxID=388810 RepID=A0A4P9WL64_9FUNG|nr:hypothetical protein BDK51DRAFT_41400 [Blyttiomyces helicus]|eukprot:RKO93132.1 hypothetical protein BDK51DRAFT_41400 [Blyttiomyces helicus]
MNLRFGSAAVVDPSTPFETLTVPSQHFTRRKAGAGSSNKTKSGGMGTRVTKPPTDYFLEHATLKRATTGATNRDGRPLLRSDLEAASPTRQVPLRWAMVNEKKHLEFKWYDGEEQYDKREESGEQESGEQESDELEGYNEEEGRGTPSHELPSKPNSLMVTLPPSRDHHRALGQWNFASDRHQVHQSWSRPRFSTRAPDDRWVRAKRNPLPVCSNTQTSLFQILARADTWCWLDDRAQCPQVPAFTAIRFRVPTAVVGQAVQVRARMPGCHLIRVFLSASGHLSAAAVTH